MLGLLGTGARSSEGKTEAPGRWESGGDGGREGGDRVAERFQLRPQRHCPAFHLHFRFRRGPEVGGRRRRRAEEVEVVPGGRFPPPSRFGAE